MATVKSNFERRRMRSRSALRRKGAGDRPRLSVHRSNQHIYAQIIDDRVGATLASASTLESDLKGGATSNIDAATKVGTLIAERGQKAGVSKVVFDRGGYRYHGRIKALADAARGAGLDF